jgi:hypothetical protein
VPCGSHQARGLRLKSLPPLDKLDHGVELRRPRPWKIRCPDGGALLINVSADWRFLESVPRSGRALLIGLDSPDLASALETSLADPEEVSALSGTFDLVVLGSTPTRRLLTSVAAVTEPVRGVVMAGIGAPGHERLLGRPSGPRVMLLRRRANQAGLLVEQVLGALPNPWNPEFMFPIEREAVSFAISRFLLSRRPGAWVSREMATTDWWWRVAAFACPGAMALMRVAPRA